MTYARAVPKDPPEFHGPGSGDELRDFDVPHDLPDSEFGQAVLARYRGRLPYYGSPEVRGIQFANGFAELAAIAFARAEFYGVLLAAQYERQGLGGLIGVQVGGLALADGKDQQRLETFEKSEEVRALVALEAQERDRAASMVEKGIKLGMEAKEVDALRSYGKTVAEFARAFTEETGMNWSDPATRRAAQRALLTARERLGAAIRPAAAAGPPLTEVERERMRRPGLES